MIEFRDLRADEVECRVAMVKENGCSLLLYKDARCDMAILDEIVGAENWQRSHELINGNLFCNVAIKCGDEWITKQDVGTESNTEKEKGQASDSFKRACFNWGIGRELYTAPFIWINANNCNIITKSGKSTTFDKFEVTEFEVKDKKIVKLAIKNTKTGAICYTYGNTAVKAAKPIICPECEEVIKPIKKKDGTVVQPADILKGCGGMCYNCYQERKQA